MSETAEEFEAGYARRSGMTVKSLHWLGRYAEPCSCGESLCTGWGLGFQWEDALIEDQLRAAGRLIQ